MFAQHATMDMHQGEGGVIADCADISEMIGEAFEFSHQCAQPHSSLRRVDAIAASVARGKQSA